MNIDIQLSPFEARVIGCLLEKQISTPDQYPLSLNALVNACNQKSNRDPILTLSESEVQAQVDALIKKHLAAEKSGFGSRVSKFVHRFCNTEFGALKFTSQELGIVCELLLRGPQTPGELRSHTHRLCKFTDVQEVETVLQQLSTRSDGPFVVRLPREPGRRESRYAHLFSGAIDVDRYASENQTANSVHAMQDSLSAAGAARLTAVEEQLAQMRAELEQLKAQLSQLLT